MLNVFEPTINPVLITFPGGKGYLLSRLRWYERILSICTAIAIFVPSWACRGFGLLLIVLLLVPQFKKRLGTEGGETDIITG